MMRPHLDPFLGEADPAKFARRPMHGLPESNFVEAAALGTAKRLALLHLLGEVVLRIHSPSSTAKRSRARTDMSSSGLRISLSFFFLILSRARLRSRKYAFTSAGVLSIHWIVRIPSKSFFSRRMRFSSPRRMLIRVSCFNFVAITRRPGFHFILWFWIRRDGRKTFEPLAKVAVQNKGSPAPLHGAKLTASDRFVDRSPADACNRAGCGNAISKW